MKFLVASIVLLLSSIIGFILINNRNYYWGQDYSTANYWLTPNNVNVASISGYEEFSQQMSLYNFLRDDINFAEVGYIDSFGDTHYIKIPDSIVEKSLYSVKLVNDIPEYHLLTRTEAITAVSEWRTKYVFQILRPNQDSLEYKVLRVYIYENN